jgi:hypothetical protein
MSYLTSATASLGLPEIRIDSLTYWQPLMQAHFPEFKDGNHSAKWVEKFRFSPSEESDVIKITEYDIKRTSGMFIELVEGGKMGYSYKNKYARILYYYCFDQKDVNDNILHPTGWTHSTKGSETGYVLRVSDLTEVSRQSLNVIKADPGIISGYALGLIKKNSTGVLKKGFIKENSSKVEYDQYTGKPVFSAADYEQYTGQTSYQKETPKELLTKSAEEVLSYEQEDNQNIDADDDHVSKLTIRDKYCMMHRIPKTNKPWLNKLINEHNKECLQ